MQIQYIHSSTVVTAGIFLLYRFVFSIRTDLD